MKIRIQLEIGGFGVVETVEREIADNRGRRMFNILSALLDALVATVE